MNRRFLSLAILSAAAWLDTGALAQSPDDVLAANASTKLTRADYQAELMRVPPENREAFASDPRRLTQFLNNILIAKTLAVDARKNGVDRDPTTQRRVSLEVDRLLAALEIERIEREAGRDFDAREAQFTAKARENFLVDRAKYQRPEQVTLSQVVVRTANRGTEAALSIAREARAKLAAGTDFAAVAKEVSDDAATRLEGGRVAWIDAQQLDPAVAKVVFELGKGALSEPIPAQGAYYVVRLDDKRPPQQQSFDEIKPTLLAELRRRHVDETREARLAAIRNDPTMIVNQPAVDALVSRVPLDMQKRSQPAPAAAPSAK